MIGRRTKAAGGALVLALVAGGLIWGFGLRGDGSGPVPEDTCRGALAVEEARGFFGGAELEFGGHTAEWVGHETEYCAAWARGEQSGGVQLRLNIRPAAAHRASGAAEETSATPIGFGWNGSFVSGRRPEAGVLVDCAPLPGKGLLVLAEARKDTDELSDAQVLQVARFATESARRAAERFGCEGPLGQRPSTVDRTEWQERPVARAEGTCRGVVGSQDAARLRLTTVSEMPAGRALTERCTMDRAAKDRATMRRFRLTAYYGPSAEQEMYLDGRYPGSVKGAVTRSQPCKGGLGTAYFKFEEFPRPDAEKGVRSSVAGADALKLVTAFATASGARHGCPVA
ncbi:hypothetical protein [Streptomyces vilmorinianum]|uniref:hypothetical protein n=1 Tax=Streptomyces vilmorinianum TaxID=3051092 RepID=UPI0010FB7635|nr:hypothetical protein [Streptomyces vilmorinianum]